MKIAGRNFDLVTIRMKGTTSGSYSMGIFKGMNVASKEKIPFEYHHFARTHFVDEDSLRANLKKKARGFLSKEI